MHSVTLLFLVVTEIRAIHLLFDESHFAKVASVLIINLHLIEKGVLVEMSVLHILVGLPPLLHLQSQYLPTLGVLLLLLSLLLSPTLVHMRLLNLVVLLVSSYLMPGFSRFFVRTSLVVCCLSPLKVQFKLALSVSLFLQFWDLVFVVVVKSIVHSLVKVFVELIVLVIGLVGLGFLPCNVPEVGLIHLGLLVLLHLLHIRVVVHRILQIRLVLANRLLPLLPRLPLILQFPLISFLLHCLFHGPFVLFLLLATKHVVLVVVAKIPLQVLAL